MSNTLPSQNLAKAHPRLEREEVGGTSCGPHVIHMSHVPTFAICCSRTAHEPFFKPLGCEREVMPSLAFPTPNEPLALLRPSHPRAGTSLAHHIVGQAGVDGGGHGLLIPKVSFGFAGMPRSGCMIPQVRMPSGL